ncbi:MAG: DEAD/DEAH box helicase, partial [Deltaproteobacteria bacterium]|nr:DEAD/DEAH box helicase [Deltaproteobacteria bacterium]
MNSFEELSLVEPLLRAVRAENYTTPTPIQAQAIPHALRGLDLLGCAQTGTGKTAAFALPTLQHLATKPPAEPSEPSRSSDGRRGPVRSTPSRPVRCLVLTPTRELASQIAETFRTLGRELPLRTAVVFGGVGYEQQERMLRGGVDILVATPGRLIDWLQKGVVNLERVEVLVLDEADQMLDMGFIHDVRRIVARVPSKRQTLFFSATMPPEIRKLSSEWLHDPVEISVVPPATTAERVEQKVFFVETADKRLLLEHLLKGRDVTRALVFSRTKHGANKIAKWLEAASVTAEAIHGNKSQNARERALESFKTGQTRVLVATDIAARGLDIDQVSHVVNFDLPNVPEVYVHRIGRTARAGAEGVAWSFCNDEEREYLRDIERITRQHIDIAREHPYASHLPPPSATNLTPAQQAVRGPATSRPRATNHRGPQRGGQRGPAPRAPQGPSSGERRPDSHAHAPRPAQANAGAQPRNSNNAPPRSAEPARGPRTDA